MISPSQAEHLIEQQLTCLPIESLPLVQCIGAVLRENIYAERDHPPFDRVSMDGIAIASNAVATGQREFSIQGTQAAGDPPLALVSSQHAIEIMTGAVLPQGCDAVVPVEQIRVAAGRATLSGDFKVAAYANVHARGSDCLQGTALLHSGIRLGAPEIAIAAGAVWRVSASARSPPSA